MVTLMPATNGTRLTMENGGGGVGKLARDDRLN